MLQVLTSGMVWGVDTVLTSDRLKDLSPARALTFVEVSYLPNDALEHCLELYPGDAKRVRSEVVWMAVRRGIPSYVRTPTIICAVLSPSPAHSTDFCVNSPTASVPLVGTPLAADDFSDSQRVW